MRRLVVSIALGALGVATIPLATEAATASAHPATRPEMTSASGVLPISTATARRLPPGTFYLLAGPDATSYDVWQVSRNGVERQLTRSKHFFGVSGFTASRAGLVLSSAPAGVDGLVRYTSHGLVPIHAGKNERAIDAGIDSSGRLVITTVPNSAHNYFLIGTTTSITSLPRWVSKAPVNFAPFTPEWGPGGDFSVVVGPDAPSVANRPYRVMIVHGTRSHYMVTGYKSTANVVWQNNSRFLAVESSTLQGEVMTLAGKRQALPRGWFGLSWSPSANQLLVRSGRRLGVWTTSRPWHVGVIGTMNRGSWVVQASWLSAPAKT